MRCSVFAAHDKFRRSIKVGMLVHGRAVSVEPYGAFVRLDHSDVTVLLHVSKVSWARVRDVGEIVAAGDRVSGMVGEIETDGRLLVTGAAARATAAAAVAEAPDPLPTSSTC